MPRIALLSLLVLLTVSCPSVPPVPPPNPPTDTEYCEVMCEHLHQLGCEEGEPVYNSDIEGPVDIPNQNCTDFCADLQGSGYFVNPKCVALVENCEQIEEFRELEPERCMP